MSVRRFFVYAKCIGILRAEESLSLAEIVSIPHMKEQHIKQAFARWKRALQQVADQPSAPTVVRKDMLIGGIPSDAAALRASMRGIPGMEGFIKFVKKNPDKDSEA